MFFCLNLHKGNDCVRMYSHSLLSCPCMYDAVSEEPEIAVNCVCVRVSCVHMCESTEPHSSGGILNCRGACDCLTSDHELHSEQRRTCVVYSTWSSDWLAVRREEFPAQRQDDLKKKKEHGSGSVFTTSSIVESDSKPGKEGDQVKCSSQCVKYSEDFVIFLS